MKAFITENETQSIKFAYSLFGVCISLEDETETYCTKCRNELKTLIRVFTQVRTEFGSENIDEAYECLNTVENHCLGMWSANEFNISDLDMCEEDSYIGRALAREYYISLARERAPFINVELSDEIEF